MDVVVSNEPLNDAALALIAACEEADGFAPISEGFVQGRPGQRNVLVFDEGANTGAAGKLLGLCAVDTNGEAELCVHPAHRRQGIANTLVATVDVSSAWAHGNLPGAQALANKLGLRAGRELLVMELVDEQALANIARTELLVRSYADFANGAAAPVEWDVQQLHQQWLKVNNEAFDWHPEQGGWDEQQLLRAMDTTWWDPAGALFFFDTEDPTTLLGFHWTKWHGTKQQAGEAGEAGQEDPATPAGFGEVYVIGLAKAAQGKGLAKGVVGEGIAHLHKQGARRVILYVEADNTAAVATYERLGFHVSERHVRYER